MVSEKLKELQRSIADTLLREHARVNEKKGAGSVRLDDDGLLGVAIGKAMEKVRATYISYIPIVLHIRRTRRIAAE